MSKIEKIDILIPAYNAEKFIRKTIDSIIEQTYAEWNIIVLNDGSTDNTYKICSQLAKKDNRIKVFSQNNQGLVETRKNLLKKVKSDYFTFVDADDLLHPQALELLINAIRETDSDIVMTKRIKHVSHLFGIGKNRKKIEFNFRDVKVIDADTVIEGLLGHPKFLSVMYSKLYKATLKDTDFSSIPKIFCGEDNCASICILENAKKVAMIDERIYFYRSGGGSSKYYEGLAEDIYNFYTWRSKYIEEHNVNRNIDKSNLFHLLHTYKSLCSGCQINGKKDSIILKPMISKINKDEWKELWLFYNQLEKEKLNIPKERESWKIEIKKMIATYL